MIELASSYGGRVARQRRIGRRAGDVDDLADRRLAIGARDAPIGSAAVVGAVESPRRPTSRSTVAVDRGVVAGVDVADRAAAGGRAAPAPTGR